MGAIVQQNMLNDIERVGINIAELIGRSFYKCMHELGHALCTKVRAVTLGKECQKFLLSP